MTKSSIFVACLLGLATTAALAEPNACFSAQAALNDHKTLLAQASTADGGPGALPARIRHLEQRQAERAADMQRRTKHLAKVRTDIKSYFKGGLPTEAELTRLTQDAAKAVASIEMPEAASSESLTRERRIAQLEKELAASKQESVSRHATARGASQPSAASDAATAMQFAFAPRSSELSALYRARSSAREAAQKDPAALKAAQDKLQALISFAGIEDAERLIRDERDVYDSDAKTLRGLLARVEVAGRARAQLLQQGPAKTASLTAAARTACTSR